MKTWAKFTKLLIMLLCLLITSYAQSSYGMFNSNLSSSNTSSSITEYDNKDLAESNDQETFILTANGPVSVRLSDIPYEIKKYAFEFEIDVEKLHKLSNPVINIPFATLKWHLDITPWDYEGRPFGVGPRQVLNNPSQYAQHYARIRCADTSFPLDIAYNNGRWVIIDGLHRLAKIFIAGAQDDDLIAVRVHSRQDLISCMDLECTSSEIANKYFPNIRNNP